MRFLIFAFLIAYGALLVTAVAKYGYFVIAHAGKPEQTEQIQSAKESVLCAILATILLVILCLIDFF